jgi:flagellar motor switch protein FliN/FliY
MAKTNPNPASASPGAKSSADAGAAQALDNAQAAVDELAREAGSASGFDLPDLGGAGSIGASGGLDMLGDVELSVSVELGRTEMLVEDILRLSEGSVVELDKLAGDPVDVFVNHRLVARGEVLVLNDNFCIRISEIVDDLQEQVQEAAAQGT